MRELLIVTVVALAVGPALAQETLPAFQVVSVKANRSNADGQSQRMLPGGRAVIVNTPLRRLILMAYELFPQQLVGGPAWLDSDHFDIVAQANENLGPSVPGGRPGRAQQMLQRLLAERFGLAVHPEARELPVYELTVARADGRLGPRISPATVDCLSLMTAYGRGEAPMPPPSQCGASGRTGRVSMRGGIMPMFVRSLVGMTDRIVLDRTGLTGSFDFDLEFTPDSGAAPETTAPGTTGASLFTALEEQLGLKLRPAREPVPVLVIDRVAHPTEN
ncbi:MAG: TIGR03435 family protein [Vicinamibacterales bacterium]